MPATVIHARQITVLYLVLALLVAFNIAVSPYQFYVRGLLQSLWENFFLRPEVGRWPLDMGGMVGRSK